MKIAFIIPSLVNQGPIVVVHNIVTALLDKTDVIIHVYYFDDKKGLDFSCPTIRISMNQSIDFDQYDVIHSHCLRPDKYVAKWKRKSKIKRAVTISTLHQDTYKTFSYEYNKLLAYLLTRYWLYFQNKFDVVTTISNQLNNQYSPFLKKLITIYNGCSVDNNVLTERDTGLDKAILKLHEKYRVLGSYALITKRKGLCQVLEFLKRNTDYAFVLIGDGPALNELKELADKYSLSDRVLFHPYVKNPYCYLDNIDVYVMTSYSEGFGLSMVEAALEGKAIVCSDIPSFNEIFTREEASFFELDNIESLQCAIEFAYHRKKILGEKAYKKAVLKFSSNIMADNYLKLYSDFIR
ncbi:MAG: glycosyltransferase family 4 protein [Paludibacteraceae bacterium]|nr:glycosyltransferase family 4 protein [Paludibacteraceae bacterium]